MKKLEDYLKYEQPTKYIVENEKYSDKYDIPVLTAGKTFILGYTNEHNNVFPKEELPVIIFDDFTTECKYVDFPFKVKSSAMKILHPINNANPKYLYYYMKQIKFDNALHKRYWISQYSKIEIPDLNTKTQNEFVSKMSSLERLINIKKNELEKIDVLVKSQFVEMFGDIKEYKRLEEYSTLITKGASPKWQGIEYKDAGTLFVTSENVRDGYIDISKPKYLDNKINEILPRSILKRDDILVNIVGASIGRAAKYDYDYLANINQAVALIRTKNINNIYLLEYLNSEEAIKMYNGMKKGGARENLSLKNISDLKIPNAPIELQNKFAEFVKQIDKQKDKLKKQLGKLEELQASLVQEYCS